MPRNPLGPLRDHTADFFRKGILSALTKRTPRVLNSQDFISGIVRPCSMTQTLTLPDYKSLAFDTRSVSVKISEVNYVVIDHKCHEQQQ